MVFSTKFISGAMSQKFGSFLNGRQGLKTNSLSDPFGGQPSVSGENPKKTVYQYPLDLGGTPNQGHFVMFYVNTQDVGKLRSKNKKVIIVSSGDIALGCKKMNYNKKNLKLDKSQAIASIGQIELMLSLIHI